MNIFGQLLKPLADITKHMLEFFSKRKTQKLNEFEFILEKHRQLIVAQDNKILKLEDKLDKLCKQLEILKDAFIALSSSDFSVMNAPVPVFIKITYHKDNDQIILIKNKAFDKEFSVLNDFPIVDKRFNNLDDAISINNKEYYVIAWEIARNTVYNIEIILLINKALSL